jgi:hypothetical protein
MLARGDQVSARLAAGGFPLVYIAGYGTSGGPAAALRQRAELERTLAPCRMLHYRAVWPMLARPGSLGELPMYPDGIAAMCDRVDGLIVILPPAGYVSSAVRAEIAAARAAVLPILVRIGGGVLVPLVDCQIIPSEYRARIVVPAPLHKRRETLTAALAAMGVTR